MTHINAEEIFELMRERLSRSMFLGSDADVSCYGVVRFKVATDLKRCFPAGTKLHITLDILQMEADIIVVDSKLYDTLSQIRNDEFLTKLRVFEDWRHFIAMYPIFARCDVSNGLIRSRLKFSRSHPSEILPNELYLCGNHWHTAIQRPEDAGRRNNFLLPLGCGIVHTLDVRGGDPLCPVQPEDITAFYAKEGTMLRMRNDVVSMDDLAESPLPEYISDLRTAAAHIETCLAEHTGAVLIHCSSGVNRSPSCVLAYLMIARGMPLKQAWRHVHVRRSQIEPLYGYLYSLLQIERELFGANSSSVREMLKTGEAFTLFEMECVEALVLETIDGQAQLR
eukprot:TRINITY_DN4326_c0_g1_i1.p1 TRINITY_DN4326_c0_g1~~TRINITY_DN4326_c0_g1_i1.p1  ORF type:complete len:348 (-),score=37.48 TRINITY_DN4326_c0_g1_i1:116-1129(-)